MKFLLILVCFMLAACDFELKDDRKYTTPENNERIAMDRSYQSSLSIITEQLIILNKQISEMLKKMESK